MTSQKNKFKCSQPINIEPRYSGNSSVKSTNLLINSRNKLYL